MDPESIRQRLIRLNEEMHDPRFANQDLTYVFSLFEQGVAAFENQDFGTSSQIIDEAYRILLNPTPPPQPQVMIGPNGHPQMMVGPDGQPMPAFVVMEEPSGGPMDDLGSKGIEFIGIMGKTLVSPSLMFKGFEQSKPTSQTMVIFFLFGFFFSIAMTFNLYQILAPIMNVISTFFFFVLLGVGICFGASAITQGLCTHFGGKSNFMLTSCVYAFSLTPIMIGYGLIGYIYRTTSYFSLVDGFSIDTLIGALILLVVGLGTIAWNTALQGIGLSIIHRIGKKESISAAVAVHFLVFTILFISLFFLGGASFAYALAMENGSEGIY